MVPSMPHPLHRWQRDQPVEQLQQIIRCTVTMAIVRTAAPTAAVTAMNTFARTGMRAIVAGPTSTDNAAKEHSHYLSFELISLLQPFHKTAARTSISKSRKLCEKARLLKKRQVVNRLQVSTVDNAVV